MQPANRPVMQTQGWQRGTGRWRLLGPKLETYMNIKMQKLLPITAAAMLCAAAASNASADQVVKIGHVAPLTGGIAHLGKDNENGARLAVEEINAKGLTIGGQKITLQLDPQD